MDRCALTSPVVELRADGVQAFAGDSSHLDNLAFTVLFDAAATRERVQRALLELRDIHE
jgi:hypothetical protein